MSQVEGMEGIGADRRRDIESLETLGCVTDEFHDWGHTFVMRTLTGEEELAVSVVTKLYVETLGQAKAWAWGNVAMSLQAVDGDSDFCPPIGPDPLEFAQARFKYCTSKWYFPLAERLFEHFYDLQVRAGEALEEMRNFTPASPPSSSPEPDSLTDLGISPEELAPEPD